MPGYQNLANFPGNIAQQGATFTGTTITAVSPSPTYSIPAGSLTVGSTYRVTAFGRYTSSASATNLTMTLGVGANSWASAATAITVSLTNAPWRLEFIFRVASTGTSGTAWGQGKMFIGSSVSNMGNDNAVPGTANATITLDTTAAANVVLSFTSTVAQSYTCDFFAVECLTTVA